MFHLRLLHNFRTVVWLVLVALVPVLGGTLYWANQTGLSDDWRHAIEQEISKRGAYVKIASLKYVPLQGFVGENVRIFAEPGHKHEISRLERIQIVLDNARLARGEFRLRKIVLKNARLALPVDPKNPAGESLHFTGIYGTVLLSGERMIEARDARAEVGGIHVLLNAKILAKIHGKKNPDDDKNDGKRREMVARILNELEQWNFDTERPARIRLDVDADMTDKTSVKVDFKVESASIEKNQYKLTDFLAEGNLSGHLLTVREFSANDSRGSLSGHGDYHILSKAGSFDSESSIEIPRLLKSWLATPIHVDLLAGGGQQIRAAGDFNLSEPLKPLVNLTGHALCGSIMFRGVSFDSVETWFSWQNGKLFLRDLKIKRPDGEAEAKVMMEDHFVRLKLHTTIPALVCKPFFNGLPLEHVLGDFSENDNASTEISLEGTFDTRDPLLWAYSGKGVLKNMSYRGVPARSVQSSFVLNHHELDFHDGAMTFDYTNYPMRKAFNGPQNGTAKFKRIFYDAASRTVEVESVRGDIWMAPLLRCFAPKIADELEQYRFHKPPEISGSGVVDVTSAGRTDIQVEFSTPDKADYKFLGKNVTFTRPEATVLVHGDEVEINKLSLEAFGGTVAGDLNNSGKTLSGELSWSKLALAGLSSTYGFNMKGGGDVTGRLAFSLPGADVSAMNGEGLVALENAELFSVPILGPLSPVMATVLDNERAGFQRAKSAFCTFNIRDGILRTSDFQTATNSVTFAGDGAFDLSEKTIDFTVRLNARGLLGLLTLPLRPFYGFFQFRGTGSLEVPVWENVHFTSPPAGQNDILLAPPPRALVVPE